MRIAYVGNFGPPHSTENHIKRALENNGHQVACYQEGEGLPDREIIPTFDFILWTRTKSLAAPHADTMRMMIQASRANVPVIGYHLDIWWGLKREREIFEDPFFQVDLLVTADGGHEQQWADAGVVHYWMPPGVSRDETLPGMFRSDLTSPIAFVGSWDGGYHPESAHRHELVRWLKQNFTRDCAFWPQPGQHALRGNDLRDLYASVDIVVGDSCFAGTGLKNYWSDRIPETLGRAGFLLHPHVDGMEDQGFTSHTMACWDAFDWDALGTQIDHYLSKPDERTIIKAQGRELVLEHHTYERRMEQLVELLQDRHLIPDTREPKIAMNEEAAKARAMIAAGQANNPIVGDAPSAVNHITIHFPDGGDPTLVADRIREKISAAIAKDPELAAKPEPVKKAAAKKAPAKKAAPKRKAGPK